MSSKVFSSHSRKGPSDLHLHETIVNPFLKWPGGKRWFVHKYNHLLPSSFNTYIEPFLGSGAVFFHLKPEKAILSDINPEVIQTYEVLKTNWKAVRRSLQYHQRKHSSEYYYNVRAKYTGNNIQRASRMIYLNRTCFNGIYRVNCSGEFNVPIGSKTNVILDTDDFEGVSDLLQNATLMNEDFSNVICKADCSDFVFADPPYTVRHNLNGFLKYNEKLFSWEDQERLAQALLSAKERGAKVLLTNANHKSIRDLYGDLGFDFKTVSRYSSIAASADDRRKFEELVISANLF